MQVLAAPLRGGFCVTAPTTLEPTHSLIPYAFLAGDKDNRISIAIEEPIYLTSTPNFEQLQDVLRGDSPAVEVLNGRVVSAPGALEGVLGGVREELSLGWGTGSGPGRRHTKFPGVCECCGSSAVPCRSGLACIPRTPPHNPHLNALPCRPCWPSWGAPRWRWPPRGALWSRR